MSTFALVAASDFNAEDFERRYASGQFYKIVAIDGGYAHLESVECKPDIVLGDFDSLGYVPDFPDVEVHPSHKDESDLELAFSRLADYEVDAVYVYGAIGGRLDHTIAGLQMAARFAEAGLTVTFVTPDCMIRILAGPGGYDLPAIERGTVSVFSATDASHGVTEAGMEYSLDHATLTNRTSLGLSNELIGKPVTISVERGTLYVFHPLAL